jgi:hypothetical protein
MAVIGHLHSPAPFYPGKEAYCAFSKRLGGPESRSVHFGEDKSYLPLPGIELRFLGSPPRSPNVMKL